MDFLDDILGPGPEPRLSPWRETVAIVWAGFKVFAIAMAIICGPPILAAIAIILFY